MKVDKSQVLLKCIPFNIEQIEFKNPIGNDKSPYHRLLCPDWANIVALTPDRKAIMVEQFRVGVLARTLEVPGGIIQSEKTEDPMIGAMRELEEETGYVSNNWVHLLSISPNPAIQNNRIHMYLATDCTLATNRQNFPDATEELTLRLIAWDDLLKQARKGAVNHALSVLSILLAQGRLG